MNMEKIKNFLKRFLGNNCEICTYENEVQAYNSSIRILVVEPHSGNNYKYLLRVSAIASFDRWANSTYFEKFLDTPEEVVTCLNNNELDIYKTLLNCLSEDYQKIKEETCEWRKNNISYYEQDKLCSSLANKTKEIESNPNRPEDYYVRATRLYISKNYEEALVNCEKAIELDAKNEEYYYAKGVTLRALNRHKEALIDFIIATKLNPQCAESFYIKGLTLYELNQYEEALTDLIVATKLNPKKAKYFYVKGLTLLKLNRYKEALIDLSESIKLDSAKAEYYNSRGVVLLKLNQSEEALIDSKKAIELDSTKSEYYANLGRVYIEQFLAKKENENFAKQTDLLELELQLAKANLDKAIELNPTNTEYYCDLAMLHLAQFTIKIENKPFNEATINLGKKELQLALRTMDKAIKLDPIKIEYSAQYSGIREYILDLLNHRDEEPRYS